MDYLLLLSDEEYQDIFEKGHDSPYTFEVLGNGKAIFYFGVEHSRDPRNLQWSKLESYWNKFVSETNGKRIVFLEGPGGFKVDGLARNEIIEKFGESGLLMSFAGLENISFIWPNLSMQEEAKQLENGFDSDLVKYYIFARSVGAWLKIGNMGTFDEVISKAIASTAKCISGASSEFSFYDRIHERIFGNKITVSEQENLMKAAVPIYHDSVINDIARASSRLRNEHIVSEVEKYWNDGYSVFMLFGSAHAVIQEKALKSLGK